MKTAPPVATALALLLVACSDAQSPPPAPGATTGPEAAGAPASTDASAVTSQPAIASRFIPFSTCKVIESNEEEDWSTSRCEALAGYTVLLDYSDVRDDLRIAVKGGKLVSLGISAAGGGGFNSLGPTFEWRGKGEGAGFVPHALIVRNGVSEDPEHSERQTSTLAVIDLARLCVIALVRPGADQNVRAQAIADGGTQACLTRGD